MKGKSMAGLFISFEGVDGVGKTTQVGRLRDYALSLGYDVVVTREPGGTPLGRALRPNIRLCDQIVETLFSCSNDSPLHSQIL